MRWIRRRHHNHGRGKMRAKRGPKCRSGQQDAFHMRTHVTGRTSPWVAAATDSRGDVPVEGPEKGGRPQRQPVLVQPDTRARGVRAGWPPHRPQVLDHARGPLLQFVAGQGEFGTRWSRVGHSIKQLQLSLLRLWILQHTAAVGEPSSPEHACYHFSVTRKICPRCCDLVDNTCFHVAVVRIRRRMRAMLRWQHLCLTLVSASDYVCTLSVRCESCHLLPNCECATEGRAALMG